MSPRSQTVLLSLIPGIVVLALIAWLGVNVPKVDQWGLPYVFRQVAEGGNWWELLWTPNNEHRVVFPKFIFISLAFASGWNVKLEMLVSWGVAAVGFLAIAGLACRTIDLSESGRLFAITLLTCSLFYFSFVQYENWLWGFQLAFFLTQTSFLLAVYVVAGTRMPIPLRFVIAAVLCVISSFSMIQGLFSWMAMLPLIAVTPVSGRDRIVASTVWVAVSALIWLVYFDGIDGGSGFEGTMSIAERLAIGIPSTFGLLGAPLTIEVAGFSAWPAILAGVGVAFGVLAAGWLGYRGGVDLRVVFAWFSLVIFGGMFCLAVAMGRTDWGMDVLATRSRYTTGPSLVWIAFVALTAAAMARAGRFEQTKVRFFGGCAVLAALAIANSALAVNQAVAKAAQFRLAELALPLVKVLDTALDVSRASPLFSIVPGIEPPHNGVEFVRKAMDELEFLGFRSMVPKELISFEDDREPIGVFGVEPSGGFGNSQSRVGSKRRLELTGSFPVSALNESTRPLVAISCGSSSVLVMAEAQKRGDVFEWFARVPALAFGTGSVEIFAWVFEGTNLLPHGQTPQRIEIVDRSVEKL